MRILAFSDLHGAAEGVRKIVESEGSFDVLVLAGDLTRSGSSPELEATLKPLLLHGKPVLAVLGNMDAPELEEALTRHGVSINARGIQVGEAGFFGVSASPFTPFHTPYEISEEEVFRRAETGWKMVRECPWKVFIPHAPPSRTRVDRTFSGIHAGSTAVRQFIERRHPDLVICGHIHEARGVDAIGETRIVNCGPAGRGAYCVITLAREVTIETKGGK
jgi:Icc-related predicted phosphoesterase